MTLLNCDMGESYGIWRLGDDRRIMPAIHIANVACGFHASDFNHMRATVQLAKAHGVQVGAHPSLPDRQGFGRREMKIGREELVNCLIYQIGALKGFLEAEGMSLTTSNRTGHSMAWPRATRKWRTQSATQRTYSRLLCWG
jgi:5-oxoprolinase (ATP-hydrolysing) subunit A